MAGEGRSARTRQQRLERRRQETRGFDEGGSRRPFYRRRWFKPVIAIGVIGILASLVGGSLFLIAGNNPQGGTTADSAAADAPIVRINSEDAAATAAAEAVADEKPQFDAPPTLALVPNTDYRAVLVLESGTVTIDLFQDLAPTHVNNFVFLAEQGFFDGLTFHRVLENFVAQGGDPTATGTGGAGYVLPDEQPEPSGALTLGNNGIIAMARGGAGASSSQFFITLAPQGQLDNLSFTAFGIVTEGLDLVRALPLRDPAETPTPPPGAQIVSVRIEQGPATAGGG
ncbi:MAG: Peptidyl-prolyl cis-trans isomerase (rotamase) - cyclophilin family [Chloroflexi bacterium]|nr:MAG: Peptidyl-prolyl cis-trans isomerase (rotamase) - cyclophilin family [Chloroflexota bacterium]